MSQTGKVVYFDDLKGYGFIDANEAEYLRVNYKNIVTDGFKTLQVGDRVEFDVGEPGNAKNVRVVKKAEDLLKVEQILDVVMSQEPRQIKDLVIKDLPDEERQFVTYLVDRGASPKEAIHHFKLGSKKALTQLDRSAAYAMQSTYGSMVKSRPGTGGAGGSPFGA